MRLLTIIFGLLFVAGVTGCGGGPDNNAVIEVKYDAAQVIKDGMEGVKKSGRLGSSFSQVLSAARDLKAKDPAKGEAVEKSLTELRDLTDSAKIKAKADEIIKSL